MRAEDYRGRSTAEIEKEQKELNRLRFITRQKGLAWWEWNGEKFIVSPEWEKLTGYDSAKIFPKDIQDLTLEIRSALIHRWSELVAEKDKAKVTTELNTFLLYNNSCNCMEVGYTLITAHGEKLVLSTACSIWENGKLTSLFAQVRDIGKYLNQANAAEAIAKLDTQKDEIATQKKQLSNLTDRTNNLALIVKAAAPAIIGILTALVTAGEPLIKQIVGMRRRLSGESRTIRLSPIKSGTLLAALDEASFQKLETLVAELATKGKAAEMGIYEPSYLGQPFPLKYRVFLHANIEEGSEKVLSAVQQVSESEDTSSRANIHMAIKIHTYREKEGSIYHTSQPFEVRGVDGKKRLFYIEIESEGLPSDEQKALLEQSSEAAKQILAEAMEAKRQLMN